MPIRLLKGLILTFSVLITSLHLSAAGAPVKRSLPAQTRPTTGNIITAAPGNAALTAAYNVYLSGLRQRIDNKWYLADGHNHVVLSMGVAADGSVTRMEVTSTPRNPVAEQAASDAFNEVQPLPALPSGSNAISLTLTFDSKASQHDNERNLSGKIEPAAKYENSLTNESPTNDASENSRSAAESNTTSSNSADSSSSSMNNPSDAQSETK